ncbi:MAG: hypothetical protein AAFR87_30135 [Bacteroidota bacterium]
MTDTTTSKIPIWFWVVSAIALLWNSFGAMAYLGQVRATPEVLASLPEAERLLIENRPTWVTAAFAIAVWTGVLGSLFLLVRKAWATPIFMVSLGAALIQTFYNFFLTNAIETTGSGGIGFALTIILMGFGLVWFSRKSQADGLIS